MAQASQNVTADHLISATVKYSNKDDDNRVYDISANARIENGQANNFDSGEVRKKSDSSENMDGMSVIATFNASGEKNLNLYIYNADATEAKVIMDAVYAFMADVKTNVSINPVNA